MRTATDLRDTILREASDLFARQGYTATSIKQIAAAAGCTTAALYYYFEDGKSQILREVIRSYSLNIEHMFDSFADTPTLAAFLVRLGQTLAHVVPDMLRRMTWVLAEFPNLPTEEQNHMHAFVLGLHRQVNMEIARFVDDPEEAQQLAWFVFCAYFGYEQVFLTLDMQRKVPLSYDQFAHIMAQTMAAH